MSNKATIMMVKQPQTLFKLLNKPESIEGSTILQSWKSRKFNDRRWNKKQKKNQDRSPAYTLNFCQNDFESLSGSKLKQKKK